MKFSVLLAVLALALGTSCKPRESEQLRTFRAEMAMKNRRLSLLEERTEEQRELIESGSRKERENVLSSGVELSVREQRIRDLQRQLDYSNTLVVKTEAMAQEMIERQRKQFQTKVEELQERVTRLEKELAGKR